MEQQINQVSDTAFMAAAYRAMETERPNAIFRDPLAEKLSGDRGRKIIESLPRMASIGGWTVVIRTRMIDDFIQSAIADGVDTILNLGSGLDTRPYRMELPDSLRWIEVDFPHVIDFKESQLSREKPRCQLERVSLNLADIEARRSLFKEVAARSKKVFVLTEAVTPYLSEESVASLGADLLAFEPIAYWAVDYFSPISHQYRRQSGMSKSMEKAPFLFEPDDYFRFFSQVGWKPKEIRYCAQEGERLHRPAPFPFAIRMVMGIRRMFSSAEGREGMMKHTGFVVFEPVDRKG